MLIAHMTALILMQKKTIDCSRLKFLVSHAEGNSSALNLSGIPMSVLGVYRHRQSSRREIISGLGAILLLGCQSVCPFVTLFSIPYLKKRLCV